jgi:tetratricopeptide (TPR) repeat protein
MAAKASKKSTQPDAPPAEAVSAGIGKESAEATLLRLLSAVASGKGLEELGDEFGDLEASDLFRQMDQSPRTEAQDQAQDLAWEALEAETDEEALVLCERALAIDPDCVDALVERASLTTRTNKEMIEALEHAVAAGERSLGQAFIEAHTGSFWSLIETRPYMRARMDLANRLSERSPRKAIDHFEALLKLNPNDNQGARYMLLATYLRQRDLKGAASLFERYPDDIDLSFKWGRVLERFLAGDMPGASTALLSARRANPFFEQYISMRLPVPKERPTMYVRGSREEAVVCLAIVLPAWSKHLDAMYWLLDRLKTAVPGQRATKLRPAKARKQKRR